MYRGDYAAGATVRIFFSTSLASGARGAFSDALEANDVRIYKDGGTTERTSTSGVTVTSAFDSLVGVHCVTIDLSDNADAGFYAAGHDYVVVLYPDTELVDSLAVGAPIGEFSIQNRQSSSALATAQSDITAIKAKTDLIPAAGPPDAAHYTNARGDNLANLDASVAAVKAKTDNLPSDPADESLIIAATDALAALLTAIKATTDALPASVIDAYYADPRSLIESGTFQAGNSPIEEL